MRKRDPADWIRAQCLEQDRTSIKNLPKMEDTTLPPRKWDVIEGEDLLGKDPFRWRRNMTSWQRPINSMEEQDLLGKGPLSWRRNKTSRAKKAYNQKHQRCRLKSSFLEGLEWRWPMLTKIWCLRTWPRGQPQKESQVFLKIVFGYKGWLQPEESGAAVDKPTEN